MFKAILPPSIESSPECHALVARLSLDEQRFPHLLQFAALALTHKFYLAQRQDTAVVQQDYLIQLGYKYLEFLVAHSAIEANNNITAEALQDSVRRKRAMCEVAEGQLKLSATASLPVEYKVKVPPDALLTLHAGFLGALAVAIPYPDLAAYYSKYYGLNTIPQSAGVSFKTLLQEFSQDRGHGLPKYSVVNTSGPDHAREFQIQIDLGGLRPVVAKGASKKRGEEAAAEKWLRTHASSFLDQRLMKHLSVRIAHLPASSAVSQMSTDNRTLEAAGRFGIGTSNTMWIRRAFSHPSVRSSFKLPEFEDNRALAVFGGLLLHTVFAHFVVSSVFESTEFISKRISLAILVRHAISNEALSPFVDTLGLMKHVRTGPQISPDELLSNQRVSFFESLIAARFLSAPNKSNFASVFEFRLKEHFQKTLQAAENAEVLKSPLTRLAEFAGCHRISTVVEAPTRHSGPDHAARHIARIRFTRESTKENLVIRGGIGSSGTIAGHSLASALLPILREVHHDFNNARVMSSGDLVDKLAILFLPSAFAAAPTGMAEAVKWRNWGLLGTGHLACGDFESFSRWIGEATRYLQQSGAPLPELERRVVEYYQLIDDRKAWDVRTAAQAVVAEVKNFASSDDALMKIRNLKQELFFTKMQELLRVLSLAAKANEKQTTLREAFDGLELLRKRDNQVRWTFEGPDLVIDEREGATIELCAEILDALSVSTRPLPVQVSIRTATQDQTATVVIQRISDGSACPPNERLEGSLLIRFLKAEGFIETICVTGNEVACVFPKVRTRSFARKVITAIESPFAGLKDDTRAALSKLLHDLKNHLIGAEIATAVKSSSRTMIFRSQTEASEHLDAASRLADQFASLAGVLGQAKIHELSVTDFFKRLCARLFATLPQNILLGVPSASESTFIWTSEQFIESIIDNLVRNSVDAMNGQGRLELASEIDEGSGTWIIKVRDTGPGIPKELLQRLVAGEAVSSSKVGGSGVGMLTVVSMLRRIGGKITGISPSTGGIEWTLCIPSLTPAKEGDELVPTESLNLSTE